MRTARLTPWVLVGPALALVTVFVALPVVAVAALTLLRVDLLGGSVSFTGLQNLATETTDPEFGRALANTLLYTVYTVGPSVAGGLAAALLIHGSGRGAAFWRGAYFLPAACTLVAMAGVWRWMFAADAGVIDRLLAPVLGLRDWLGDPSLALVALAVVGVWHQVGLVAVIYLAALANVNPDSLDSARLDGAGPGGRFRHVVWPTLGPTTVFVLVLMIGNALQAYDTVAAMTRGGPLGATQTLTYVMWVRGIEYFDLGRAAVLAVVLLVAALAVASLSRSRWGRGLERAGRR